jgi:hypothetical protein
MLQDCLTQGILNVAKGNATLEKKLCEAIWSAGLNVTLGREELMDRAQKMFVPGGALEQYRAFSSDVYLAIQNTMSAYGDDGMNRFANPGPFTVQGLVIEFNRLATSHAVTSGEYSMRQDYEGTVFYLPPGLADNDKVRDRMQEKRAVYLTTFMPPSKIDEAVHASRAIVFDSLTLVFDAVGRPLVEDERPACSIDGTPEAQKRVNHVSFGDGKNPCDACSCATKKSPWGR